MEIKRYLPAIIIIFAFASLFVLWRILNPPLAKVVEIVPQPNAEDISLDAQGRVVFDRAVDPNGVELLLTPQAEVQISWSQDQKSLGFKFKKELEPDTTYRIEVTGRRVAPFYSSFKTEFPAVEVGIGSERAAEASEQYAREHPLVEYLPVLTKDFKITEKLGGGRYKVTLYGASVEEARSRALAWFREHGVDPETIEIEWIE